MCQGSSISTKFKQTTHSNEKGLLKVYRGMKSLRGIQKHAPSYLLINAFFLSVFLMLQKLVFHFQTLLDNFERTVIDNSHKNKQPAEIFVGKMFKMEVWEVLLTSMRIGEVAEFWCDAIVSVVAPIKPI